MLINENGLVRAIKNAYKAGGYIVNNLGDTMAIYTDAWFIKCHRAILPRKALAVIVEQDVYKRQPMDIGHGVLLLWSAGHSTNTSYRRYTGPRPRQFFVLHTVREDGII